MLHSPGDFTVINDPADADMRLLFTQLALLLTRDKLLLSNPIKDFADNVDATGGAAYSVVLDYDW